MVDVHAAQVVAARDGDGDGGAVDDGRAAEGRSGRVAVNAKVYLGCGAIAQGDVQQMRARRYRHQVQSGGVTAALVPGEDERRPVQRLGKVTAQTRDLGAGFVAHLGGDGGLCSVGSVDALIGGDGQAAALDGK